MNNRIVAIFTLLVLILTEGITATSLSAFLSYSDKVRLKQVFSSAWDLQDLPSVHYAVLGHQFLGEPVPKQSEVCKFLAKHASDKSASIESVYYAASAWKVLKTCAADKLPTNIADTFRDALNLEISTISDMFCAFRGLHTLGEKKGDIAHLLSTVQETVKQNDNLLSMGYSLHIAAMLGPQGVFAFDRIEDVIAQADEVDGQYLQFEGGLSVTALIISGAYNLATSLNKPPRISGEQAVKFANYFISRRSVQTVKGAYHLLEVINMFTDNKFHIPVAVTVSGKGIIFQDQPHVTLRVSNLLGNPVASTHLTVTAESATRVGDDVVVLSKKKFDTVASNITLYTLNMLETKPERGVYRLSVSAVPAKSDPRLIGNIGALLTVKVLSDTTIENVEIGVMDADQSTQPKLTKVKRPSKLGSILEADTMQKLLLKFNLKDMRTGKPMTVHQAFLKLTHKESSAEIIFVPEVDSSKLYKFDIDIGSRADEFGHLSGVYSVELIIGDAVISNSFLWQVADVKLKFSEERAEQKSEVKHHSLYTPKPEIKHLFREPERRPPASVSNLFTALVGLPLLILFIIWAKLGVNISNFPLSLSALGFHLGLGGIFALFGVFWLQLNMFQTLKYLVGIGVVTFLCGNKLLSRIAEERKKS